MEGTVCVHILDGTLYRVRVVLNESNAGGPSATAWHVCKSVLDHRYHSSSSVMTVCSRKTKTGRLGTLALHLEKSGVFKPISHRTTMNDVLFMLRKECNSRLVLKNRAYLPQWYEYETNNDDDDDEQVELEEEEKDFEFMETCHNIKSRYYDIYRVENTLQMGKIVAMLHFSLQPPWETELDQTKVGEMLECAGGELDDEIIGHAKDAYTKLRAKGVAVRRLLVRMAKRVWRMEYGSSFFPCTKVQYAKTIDANVSNLNESLCTVEKRCFDAKWIGVNERGIHVMITNLGSKEEQMTHHNLKDILQWSCSPDGSVMAFLIQQGPQQELMHVCGFMNGWASTLGMLLGLHQSATRIQDLNSSSLSVHDVLGIPVETDVFNAWSVELYCKIIEGPRNVERDRQRKQVMCGILNHQRQKLLHARLSRWMRATLCGRFEDLFVDLQTKSQVNLLIQHRETCEKARSFRIWTCKAAKTRTRKQICGARTIHTILICAVQRLSLHLWRSWSGECKRWLVHVLIPINQRCLIRRGWEQWLEFRKIKERGVALRDLVLRRSINCWRCKTGLLRKEWQIRKKLVRIWKGYIMDCRRREQVLRFILLRSGLLQWKVFALHHKFKQRRKRLVLSKLFCFAGQCKFDRLFRIVLMRFGFRTWKLRTKLDKSHALIKSVHLRRYVRRLKSYAVQQRELQCAFLDAWITRWKQGREKQRYYFTECWHAAILNDKAHEFFLSRYFVRWKKQARMQSATLERLLACQRQLSEMEQLCSNDLLEAKTVHARTDQLFMHENES